MKVATDPKFLESIANLPSVFKYVSCKGVDVIDFSSIWEDCIGLEFETGGFLFHKQADRVYEVHTLFMPKSKNVDLCAKDAAAYMFSGKAVLLLTQIARDLPHVRRLALRQGFTKFGSGDWHRTNETVVADYYELSKEIWLEKIQCL